ncbi:MAG TPA: hypothetical protein IAB57_03290 [Candidatus Fimivivens faecavium]|nr:hypothetical protein [Candidatus Fimivivens faecavium]
MEFVSARAAQAAEIRDNPAFRRLLQEALLAGLLHQGKLTQEQYDRCVRALSKNH